MSEKDFSRKVNKSYQRHLKQYQEALQVIKTITREKKLKPDEDF